MQTDIAAILQSAIADHQGGRYESAESAYRLVLEIQAQHPAANHNLGVLILQRNQADAALKHLLVALEADPKNPQHWLSLIECMLQVGMWANAKNLLDSVIAKGLQHPSLAEFKTRIRQARDAEYKQNLMTKLHTLASKQASANTPKNLGATIQGIATQFSAQQFAAVEAAALDALGNAPQHGKLWHLLGMALLQQGKNEAAIFALERGTELSPKDAELWAHKGHAYALQRAFTEAERCFKRSLSIAPGNAEALNLAGSCALEAGRFADARIHLDRALKSNPSSAEAHSNLGHALQGMGDFVAARQHYQRALALQPAFPEALNNLAGLCLVQELTHEAVDLFRRALELNPESIETRCNLAQALQKTGQFESAQSECELALKLNHRHAEAHNCLANILKDLRQFEQATAHYSESITLNPTGIDAYNNLAALYLVVGKPMQAIECCSQSLSIEPANPVSMNTLGCALRDCGKAEEAVAQYRHALELDPGYVAARTNLAQTLSKQQRFDEAQQIVMSALKDAPDSIPYQTALMSLSYARGDNALAANIIANAGKTALDNQNVPIGLASDWLSSLLQTNGQEELVLKVARDLLALPGSIERFQGTIATYAMLHCWQADRCAELAEFIQQSAGYQRLAPSESDKNTHIFHRFVMQLAAFRQRTPELYSAPPVQTLHVIGESHSLATANAVFNWSGVRHVARTHFVMGVKMYHLANADTNKYKTFVANRISAIPSAENILITIGEIDCRASEGIWHVAKKHDLPVAEVIESTVDAYLSWLAAQFGDRGAERITIQGIPAPRAPLQERQAVEDEAAYLAMIASVNARIKEGTRKLGWSFLDVHAATSSEDGMSDGQWHIDARHLQPAFYAQADSWRV